MVSIASAVFTEDPVGTTAIIGYFLSEKNIRDLAECILATFQATRVAQFHFFAQAKWMSNFYQAIPSDEYTSRDTENSSDLSE